MYSEIKSSSTGKYKENNIKEYINQCIEQVKRSTETNSKILAQNSSDSENKQTIGLQNTEFELQKYT